MSHLRRLILALALSAGLAPAFAQTPVPVFGTGATGLSVAVFSSPFNASPTIVGQPFLGVNQGGTGVQTLPANSLLLGKGGTLPMGAITPFSPGQVLIDQGPGVDPQFRPISGAININSSGVATLTGGSGGARNVNTSAPLGGGGPLSADLTLTCATCATTTNGGPLSASAPIVLSPAGVISMPNPLPIANGGTGAATQGAAAVNIFPTPIRAGDLAYWNGSAWVALAGNNSGTQVLQETASGVPSWATVSGTGTVTTLTAGAGISFSSGATCTTACTVAWIGGNVLEASPTAPAGTTSTTGVMMGLGSTCKITPAVTGRVEITFSGSGSNSTSLAIWQLSAQFGTGAAPANAAAPAGTLVGTTSTATAPSASGLSPFYAGGIITGLTLGTALWFDLDLLVSAGTGTINNVHCTIREV
jgi:hypothetical protein